MKNWTFVTIVFACVLVLLGATAFHYNLQTSPSVRPVLVVYHDNALRPGEEQRVGDRYWTLGVRSDGSSVEVNSVPDSTGQVGGIKSVGFKDRYIVVDPQTTSITTYKPRKPMFGARRDCLGTSAGSILGHPLKYVRESSKTNRVLIESWVAVDLNCIALREHVSIAESDGKRLQFYREAVSVIPGDPPASYFEIPSDYKERGPAQLNDEYKTRFPGQHLFGSQQVVDKLEGVYDAGRPR